MKQLVILGVIGVGLVACSGAEPAAGNVGGSAGTAGASGSSGSSGASNNAGRGGGGEATAGGSGGAAAGQAGFTFVAGVCAPQGPTAAELGASFEVVLDTKDAFKEVYEVVAGPAGVFFHISGDGIYRLTSQGTKEPLVLAPQASQPQLFGNELYYFDDTSLKKVDVTAAPPTPVVLNAMVPHDYYDKNDVVFLENDTLMHVAVGQDIASANVVLDTAALPTSYTDVFEGYVYFSEINEKTVRRVAVSGGTPETLFSDPQAYPQVVLGAPGAVYFGDGGHIMRAPVPAGEVKEIGVTGPRTGIGSRPVNLLVDGTRLYWTDESNNVGWTAQDGSSCGLVVADVRGSTYSIALDDQYFYIAYDRSLARIRR